MDFRRTRISLEEEVHSQSEKILQLEKLVRWQADGSGGRRTGRREEEGTPSRNLWEGSRDVSSLCGRGVDIERDENHFPPPLQFPRLPPEVLEEIASWCTDRRDLVSLGRASFELLRVAMRQLVQRRVVRLTGIPGVSKMFCHRRRSTEEKLSGNQPRLRPHLNLTNLTHLSILLLENDYYCQEGYNYAFADRVTPATPSMLDASEHRLFPSPRLEDRLKLTSLSFVIPPIQNPDWFQDGLPVAYLSLLNLVNPTNLFLLRTPTTECPLLEYRLDLDWPLEQVWPRLRRCYCVGMVLQLTFWDEFAPLKAWEEDEGVPERVRPSLSLLDPSPPLPPPPATIHPNPKLIVFLLRPPKVTAADLGILIQDSSSAVNVAEITFVEMELQFWLAEPFEGEVKRMWEACFVEGFDMEREREEVIEWVEWTGARESEEKLDAVDFEDEVWLSEDWCEENFLT